MHITINIGTPKFLRNSYHAVHDRWGKAGVIIACIALLAALAGTALAAKGLFTKAQEKKIAQIAKKYAGKQGAPGPQGLPGAAGKDGTNGTNGAAGTNGKSMVVSNTAPSCGSPGGATLEVEGTGTKTTICNGAAGARGPQGQSGSGIETEAIVAGNEPVGHPCHEHGGVKLEVEGSGTAEFICNGEPGPVTEALPSGHTARGLWNFGTFVKDEVRRSSVGEFSVVPFNFFTVSVSFPFRVENASGEGPSFHYIRPIPGEAETFELEHAVLLGPAEGTGDLYGPAEATGDIAENSTVVTNISMSSGSFIAGQTIEGEGIPVGTKVTAVGQGTLELSSAATESKTGDTLLGAGSTKVSIDVTSGEFLAVVVREELPNPTLGQEVTGTGIAPGTTVTKVEEGSSAQEVTLTLSKEPETSQAGDVLTGQPSPIISVSDWRSPHRYPTPGEPLTGPGIPAGTTITAIRRSPGYPNRPELEISSLPTVSASAASGTSLTVGLPVGCKGTYRNPGAEPGNVCIFLAEEEERNLFTEGDGPEQFGSPFLSHAEGLIPAGSPSPLGIAFRASNWFDMLGTNGEGKKWVELSEAEKEKLVAEGRLEGEFKIGGSWAVTAP